MGWPEVAALAVSLSFVALIAWIASRAKPIDRYHVPRQRPEWVYRCTTRIPEGDKA